MKRNINLLNLKLTNVCNLNCKMCGQRIRGEGLEKKHFMDIKHMKSFFSNIPKDLYAYLWGGEPLLHPNLVEIIEFFLEKETKIAINTNGLLLDEYIDFLSNRPIETLIVSLDGLGDLHDEIRGFPGLFNKVEKSLKKYIELIRHKKPKTEVVINFVVQPENYLTLPEFCREIKSWDVDTICINFLLLVDPKLGEKFREKTLKLYKKDICSWEAYQKNKSNMFDYKLLSEIYCQIIDEHGYFIRNRKENFRINEENLRVFHERPDILLPTLRPDPWDIINTPCDRIEEALVVDDTGNILICPDFLDTVIGNIKDDCFEDFLDLSKYNLLGLDKRYEAICYRCSHRN
ncbi:MAG: radical SAM protein [Bacteroidetes bacterium]|nr:radical SAM protein [Bacteroidota bacterium]